LENLQGTLVMHMMGKIIVTSDCCRMKSGLLPKQLTQNKGKTTYKRQLHNTYRLSRFVQKHDVFGKELWAKPPMTESIGLFSLLYCLFL
jgi:hypothetical protein